MENKIKIVVNTPWKLFSELGMYFIKPFVLFYLRKVCGIKVGPGSKFYGFPRIYRHRGSEIVIGRNFECRSWWFSNPLGVNHPTIICTWEKGAKIVIGDDVGISGGSIVAAEKIRIGDRVLIGANSTIIDNDFHPVNVKNRRYSKKDVRQKPVKIEKDVFIGMNSIILKGILLKSGSVVPAGSVIR